MKRVLAVLLLLSATACEPYYYRRDRDDRHHREERQERYEKHDRDRRDDRDDRRPTYDRRDDERTPSTYR